MRLSKNLITILVLLAGLAYSIEATLPVISTVMIENSSEETEANEKTEGLAPVQIEAKRVYKSSIKVNRPRTVKFFIVYSGEQHFDKPSVIILHRRLLI